MNVNNLTVVISLFSLPIIREAVKVFSSSFFACSYNKNVLLDASFQTYSLLMCSTSLPHFFVVAISFLTTLCLSLIFLIMGDRKTGSLILVFSFFFLFVDILLLFYGKISYLFLLPFLPFMLSTIAKTE